MGNFVMIIYMMLIGAIIGGFTNSLAIKMLFRPHKTLYFGKWKVPFTPGLIPKRREELAQQIGKLVVNHLLTPESIKKKYTNKEFLQESVVFIQQKVEKWLSMEKSLEEIFSSFGMRKMTNKVKDGLDLFIEKKYEKFMDKYDKKPIRDIMPSEIIEKIDEKIPLISTYIVEKGIEYFSSIEGNLRIERMVDDFIRERSGKLGSMIQMFLGNVNLADKIQPEIVRFLQSPGTKDIMTTLLMKEWDKIQNWNTSILEEHFDKEILVDNIKKYAQKFIKIEDLMRTPIYLLADPYKNKMIQEVIPVSLQMLVNTASANIGIIVEKLRISEIVQEQILSFSLERLEEIVLSITRRELKMITYLGALLGGIIGFVQGLISFWMN